MPHNPGLHRQTNRRRQDSEGSPTLPQTLHRPPYLPTPRTPPEHDLTNIEASHFRRAGMRTAKRRRVENVDLIEQISALLDETDVEWEWVRGHVTKEPTSPTIRSLISPRLSTSTSTSTANTTSPTQPPPADYDLLTNPPETAPSRPNIPLTPTGAPDLHPSRASNILLNIVPNGAPFSSLWPPHRRGPPRTPRHGASERRQQQDGQCRGGCALPDRLQRQHRSGTESGSSPRCGVTWADTPSR